MATAWKLPKKYAWMDAYKEANPYGTLGPSPGRVATINKVTGITPVQAPVMGASMPTYQEPNWGALIAGDPDYTAAESQMNRQNQMERGNLRDAIRRAVIQSGFSVGQDEDVDAATLAAAQGNQFSTRADIDNQLRRGAATSDAELAARGLLSSGQFTENRSQLQKSADMATSQATNSLLDTITGGRTGYASAVEGRLGQLGQIKAQIAARLAQNPGLWQVQGTPAAQNAAPASAVAASRPVASNPNAGIREGTIDGAGHVFRGGRWVAIGGGGGSAVPDWLRALNARSAGMNRRY